MPTFIDTVNSLNPLINVTHNGVDLIDVSQNNLPITQASYGINTDVLIPNTSIETGFCSSVYTTSYANHANASVTFSSNLATVAFWFRKNANSSSLDSEMVFSILPAGITLYIYDGSFGINTFNSDITGISLSDVFDDKLHFIVISFDSTDVGNMRMWVDGIEKTVSTRRNTPVARTISGTQTISICGSDSLTGQKAGYQLIDASINSLCLFDGHLTDTEIQAISSFNFYESELLSSTLGVISEDNPYTMWVFRDDYPTGVVYDLTGGNNTLTVVNPYSIETTKSISPDQLNPIHFPVGSWAHTPQSSRYAMDAAPNLTVEAVIEFNSVPTQLSTFWGFGSTSGGSTALTNRQNNQSFSYEVWNATAIQTSNFNFELGVPYHIVATKDTDGMRLYVNGELISHILSTTVPQITASQFTLNRVIANSNSPSDTSVYFASLYDTTLSPSRVRAHYESLIGVIQDRQYKERVLSLSPTVFYPTTVESTINHEIVDISSTLNTSVDSGSTFNQTGLNGTQTYRHNGGAASISPTITTSGLMQMTLEFWANRDAIGVSEVPVSLSNGSSEIKVECLSDGHVQVNDTFLSVVTDPIRCEFLGGTWYHVVVVVDRTNGTIELYLNGVLASSANTGNSTLPNLSVYFGNELNGSRGFNGRLQHVAVYPSKLTGEQINDNYRLRVPTLTPVTQYQQSVISDNPVNYWTLSETSGTTIVDMMQRANGKLEGSTADVITSTGIHKNAPCLQFTGSQYISIDSPVVYSLRNGFTIEGIFTKSGVNVEYIIGFVKSGGFGVRASDEFGTVVYLNSISGYSYPTTSSIEQNQPYHFCWVFDGRYSTIYLNGERVVSAFDHGTDNDFVKFTAKNLFKIGAQYDSTGVNQFFNGKLSDIALYNYPLSRERVLEHVQNFMNGSTTGYDSVIIADSPDIYFQLNSDNFVNAQFDGVGGFIAYEQNNKSLVNYSSKELVAGSGSTYISNVGQTTPGYLRVKPRPDASLFNTGKVTFETWFNLPEISTNRYLFSINGSSEIESTNYQLALSVYPGGQIRAFWEYSGGSNVIHYSPSVVEVNKTYHLVIIRDHDTKTLKMYINTKKILDVGYTNNPTGGQSSDFNIGWDLYSTSEVGDIYISNLAVYHRDLTEIEIAEHYAAGLGFAANDVRFMTLVESPESFWILDDESGSLVDSIGNFDVSGGDAQYRAPAIYPNQIGCVEFTGVDSQVYTNNTSSPLAGHSGDFTIDGWILPKAGFRGVERYIYAENGLPSIGNTLYVGVNANGQLEFSHYNASGGNTITSSSDYIAENQIYHFAIVRSGATFTMYLNGRVANTVTGNTNGLYASTGFSIGGQPDPLGEGYFPWLGRISGLAIYKQALSSQSIIDKYNAGAMGKPYAKFISASNPALYIPFNDNSTTVVDTRHGVTFLNRQPGVAMSSIENGYSGRSMAFDGITQNTGGQSNTPFPYFPKSQLNIDTLGNFTLSMFVKPYSTPTSNQYNCICACGDNGAIDFYIYAYYIAASNQIRYEVYADTRSFSIISNTLFNADEWHHVVLRAETVSTNVNYSLIVNGVEVGTATVAAGATSTPTAVFALAHLDYPGLTNGYYHFTGEIDEVLHYNRPLSNQEITDIATNAALKYRVYGTVTQDGVPVQRNVRIYDRATGDLVVTTVSDSGGLFDLQSSIFDNTREYYVVVLDDDSDQILLDPVSRDRIIPVDL